MFRYYLETDTDLLSKTSIISHQQSSRVAEFIVKCMFRPVFEGSRVPSLIQRLAALEELEKAKSAYYKKKRLVDEVGIKSQSHGIHNYACMHV